MSLKATKVGDHTFRTKNATGSVDGWAAMRIKALESLYCYHVYEGQKCPGLAGNKLAFTYRRLPNMSTDTKQSPHAVYYSMRVEVYIIEEESGE